jgi:DNA-binding SARP family transcriptional activator
MTQARLRSQTDSGGGDVHLTLLGSFRLEVRGAAVPLPAPSQRLLALIALRGPSSRRRMAGTLWPDVHQARAMSNLRQAAWLLQHRVQDSAVLSACGDAFELHSGVRVDAQALVAAASTTLAASSQAEPRTAGLAVDLLVADADLLLPDWDEEWVDDERERLRQLHLHLLETWSDQLAAAGQYGLALEVAITALRIDKLRETAHRAVINVHRAEGNVAEARKAYAACRDVLLTEIGVEPSRQTAALVP